MEWFKYLEKIKASIKNIAFIARLEILILKLIEQSEFFKFLKDIKALNKLKKIIGIITHPTVLATINTGIGIAVLVGISVATGGVALAAIGLGFTVFNFVQTIVHSTVTERNRINIQNQLDLVQSAEDTHNKIALNNTKHPELEFLGSKIATNQLVSHDVKHTSENKSFLIHLRKNLSNHIVNIVSTIISMNPITYVMSAISFYLMLTVGARKEIDEQNAKNNINDYLANKKTQYNLPKELHEIAAINIEKQAALHALETLSQLPNLSNMSKEDIEAEFKTLKDKKVEELKQQKESLENKLIKNSMASKVKTALIACLHVLNPLHNDKQYSTMLEDIHSYSNPSTVTTHNPSQQNNQQTQTAKAPNHTKEKLDDILKTAMKNDGVLKKLESITTKNTELSPPNNIALNRTNKHSREINIERGG